MRSSKLSHLVLSILLSTSFLFAQTDSASYNSQVQFHLYGGYSLSYLNFISPNSAIRYTADLYLSFGGSDGDGTTTNIFQNNANIRSVKTGSNQNNVSVSLSAQYLFYIQAKERINLYVGGGPLINYSKGYSKNTNDYVYSPTQFQPTKYTNEISEYSFGLGVRGAAGIECFITKEISLLAEYGIYFSYNWGKTTWTNENRYPTYVDVYKNETDNKIWGAGLNWIKLGIAFRF